MLRRFFASSKPINFAVIAFIVIAFLITFLLANSPALSVWDLILRQLGVLLGFMITIGTLDFVVKKNVLTRKNSYAVLCFALFCLALPSVFLHLRIIFAGLFIMLALRRIFSLRSKTDTHKKIFDAAFWIFVASLFYFSSLLFLILLYFAILFYCAGNYRNWLMPFASLLVVALLSTTYAMYTGGIMNFIAGYRVLPTYDFTNYSSPELLVPLTFFLALYLWTSLKYFILLNAASQRHKPAFVLVLIASIIALVSAVGFAPVRDGSEFYFFFGPLAIISSRYVEKGKSKWFNELLLWAIVALPVVVLFFL
ncbi:DUF6427 family protein [Flavimarina sp. Hel_I_48]|uniref:DUF6427 family protein n=1 Tax=Flavimarina sp. Hel_I_48 TaxID=1392488 RepID=UPI0004DEFC93|nr:DUF6427 family protein [Flavimarina sp. Hel_I_48]